MGDAGPKWLVELLQDSAGRVPVVRAVKLGSNYGQKVLLLDEMSCQISRGPEKFAILSE